MLSLFSRCVECSPICDIGNPQQRCALLKEFYVDLNSCLCDQTLHLSSNISEEVLSRDILTKSCIDYADGQYLVKENLYDIACCDFRWELTEQSSSTIYLSPKSSHLPQKYLDISLELSYDEHAPWIHRLKTIIESNTKDCKYKTLSNVSVAVSEKSQEEVDAPSPESPRPPLPPKRKPKIGSSNSPKLPSKNENPILLKDKIDGEPNTSQSTVTAFIQADKLRREEDKVFRYTYSDCKLFSSIVFTTTA